MQDCVQSDFVERYKNCLEQYADKRSENYSVTPFPLYYGSQIFIINSKIFIFGLGQSKKFGVRCMISNISRNGFIEMEGVAMHKLLQNLEEILKISFDLETSKRKIELDEKLFLRFTRKNNENLAYIHDISRNLRLYLEPADIKKMMLLYSSMNIAIDRVVRNADMLHEVYKSYVQLMTNQQSSQILSTFGIQNAIPVSTENSPYWMDLSDEFLKIPLYFSDHKRVIDQTSILLFPDESLF